ncbi:MAG: lamin tail domain-containing protein [Crocinitomicaceae bacterium]|nr:lamin tail domain-containing protein [Crocinitomicaceae bacterium]MBK8925572.1 lamin tail domain-containing protein [Crocinitomicaceae bacterium]
MKSLIVVLVSLLIVSCSEELRERSHLVSMPDENSDESLSLVINEYSPKGILQNENGESADWVELYNASSETIHLSNEEWTLSDDKDNPTRFVLPDTMLNPGDFLLIWCDGLPENGTNHAPFKLSGNGERISLYHHEVLVDEVTYDQDVKKAYSYGRTSDGSNEWSTFSKPSPGVTNRSFDHYAESVE